MSNVSYSAIKTIIFFEIKDYFKEFQFNVLSPLISTLLFVFIFTAVNKYYSFNASENSYINFLIPGMIMIVIIQTSFNHLSEVLIRMKQNGSFNDYLISPISRIEIFFSFLFSSIFVCLVVAFLNLFALSFFTHFENINYVLFGYYIILCAVIFSSIGALTGFLSFTWDVQSAVSNFFILPISFFSGTFFSINSVDKNLQFIFQYNPFYYLVGGFRNSFYDNIQINIYQELFVLFTVFFILSLTILIFKKGYRVIS